MKLILLDEAATNGLLHTKQAQAMCQVLCQRERTLGLAPDPTAGGSA
ncbi:MAG: hypothetical protein GXY42_03035 [Desulfovibrionales bacterium]|nr:hypothetical protein [Desulfovibrionales bacterium]